MRRKTKERKEKELSEKDIKIDFEGDSITSCIEQEAILEKLQDPEGRENVEKCLKNMDKVFLH